MHWGVIRATVKHEIQSSATRASLGAPHLPSALPYSSPEPGRRGPLSSAWGLQKVRVVGRQWANSFLLNRTHDWTFSFSISSPLKQNVCSTIRKASSCPESQSPGVYTTWTLSTSSVSSQGSVSEGDPQQSRPFKSVFVPTAIVNPVKNTAGPRASGQGSFRKGRGSMRKSKWWQRGTCLELSHCGLGHPRAHGVLLTIAESGL